MSSLNIPEFYRRSFEANWNHTIQQELALLADKVTIKPFEGKELIISDLDQVTWTERTGRLGKSTPSEVTAKNRKLSKRQFKCQIIFDRGDKELLAQMSTPDSEIITEMKFAWNRLMDARIVEAISGTVYGGAEPYITPITLPAGQQVAVNYVQSGSPANSGLTPQKIIRARKIFRDNHQDPKKEEIYLALSPQDEEYLTSYITSAGNDVWAKQLAMHEENGTLFGFRTVPFTELTVNGGTDVETAFAWSKRRGLIVSPETMKIEIDVLPERDHAIQISAYADYAVARRYEEGVVEIYSDQSP